MKFLILFIITVLCACSPKPKVENVGLTEESFLSLHYKTLYDFFGAQGFDKAHLTPHSHHLMEVKDMQKIFLSDGVDLAGALFVNYTEKEKIQISKFPTAENLDGQTRQISDAEKEALEGLLSKKSDYVGYREQEEKDSGMYSFMWPIRAMNESCATCHGCEKGALLGAIVYQFPEKAKD